MVLHVAMSCLPISPPLVPLISLPPVVLPLLVPVLRPAPRVSPLPVILLVGVPPPLVLILSTSRVLTARGVTSAEPLIFVFLPDLVLNAFLAVFEFKFAEGADESILVLLLNLLKALWWLLSALHLVKLALSFSLSLRLVFWYTLYHLFLLVIIRSSLIIPMSIFSPFLWIFSLLIVFNRLSFFIMFILFCKLKINKLSYSPRLLFLYPLDSFCLIH